MQNLSFILILLMVTCTCTLIIGPIYIYLVMDHTLGESAL